MPSLATILLDVAVEDDVVLDLAHVVFIISKNSYNTKPTVIFAFFYAIPFLVETHCSYFQLFCINLILNPNPNTGLSNIGAVCGPDLKF
jgi:hypothetical protein